MRKHALLVACAFVCWLKASDPAQAPAHAAKVFTTMDQTEKSFQKQDAVFIGSKRLLGKKSKKGAVSKSTLGAAKSTRVGPILGEALQDIGDFANFARNSYGNHGTTSEFR